MSARLTKTALCGLVVGSSGMPRYRVRTRGYCWRARIGPGSSSESRGLRRRASGCVKLGDQARLLERTQVDP